MTAKIHLSLFQRRDRLLLLVFGFFFLFVVVAVTKPHRGEIEGNFLVLVLSPAFALGSALIEIWQRPLRLPATSLLPGVQRTLFLWNIRLILIAALLWGSLLAWLDHRIPWIPALGLSAAAFTAPLCFTWKQSGRKNSMPRESLLCWGIVVGINLPVIMTDGVARPILAHIWISGTVGWALLAFNLLMTQRRRTPAAFVQLSARNRSVGFSWNFLRWRRGISGREESAVSRPAWSYAARRDSLFHQIQATFEETPVGFWMNASAGLVAVLIHPWVAQKSAGYPLAWYRVIFDSDHSAESQASLFVLIIVLVASGLRPGLLHTGRLYPLSRQQRLTVAFAASAMSFCCNFLVVAGGSVLAGWLVGRWAGLPVPVEPAVAFLTRMAMVVPFMPLMRWGGLHLELRQSTVELFLFIAAVAVLVTLGQSFVFNWGLRAGIAVALGSIVISQLIYYTALRRFYYYSDFIQRGSRSQASELA
jgi:hypothetical protein